MKETSLLRYLSLFGAVAALSSLASFGTGCGGSSSGTKDAAAGGKAVTGIQTCDGDGKCAPADAKVCAPYSCDVNKQDCFGACTANSDCGLGVQCMNGSCGLKMKGTGCAKGSDCASGFCTDGVCCAEACQGACVSCNQTGRLGTCWPVDQGNADPRGICKDSGAAKCGETGTRDGFGACAKYAAETVCVLPSCAGDRLNTPGTCDGLGTCRAPGLQDCTPFKCANGACKPSCMTDADCTAGIACVNHSCGPKQLGGLCMKAADCASGFCVDGVCCNKACDKRRRGSSLTRNRPPSCKGPPRTWARPCIRPHQAPAS